ncbi:hypothetical protein BDD12DRAFT_810449 [Trichophaea hybrida]|nr:hypothetical protein BDD12DRAFT_810449 [Trichophaea hybrida]
MSDKNLGSVVMSMDGIMKTRKRCAKNEQCYADAIQSIAPPMFDSDSGDKIPLRKRNPYHLTNNSWGIYGQASKGYKRELVFSYTDRSGNPDFEQHMLNLPEVLTYGRTSTTYSWWYHGFLEDAWPMPKKTAGPVGMDLHGKDPT